MAEESSPVQRRSSTRWKMGADQAKNLHRLLLPLQQVGYLAQRAALEDLLTQPILALEHVHGPVRVLHRLVLGYDAHTVVVADHPVAGGDGDSRDADGHADLAETFGLAGGGGDVRARRAGNPSALMSPVSRAAPEITTPASFALEGRIGGQLAPHGRGHAPGVDDDDVSRAGHVDGLHRLGPIAGIGAHRHCRPDHPGSGGAGHDAGKITRPVQGVGDVGRGDAEQHVAQVTAAGADEVLRRDRHAVRDGMLDASRRLGGVGGFGDRSADDDDGGSRVHGLGGGLGVDAAGHGDRDGDGLHHAAQDVEGGLARHLFVDGHVDADVAGAHSLCFPGPGHGVGDADHVHDDLRRRSCVPPRRTP